MELLVVIAIFCISAFVLLLGSFKLLEFIIVRLAVRNDGRFDEIAAAEIRGRLADAVESRRGLLENKRAVRLGTGSRDLRGWESDVRQFVSAHGEIVASTREARVFDERFDEFRQFVDGLLADGAAGKGARS